MIALLPNLRRQGTEVSLPEMEDHPLGMEGHRTEAEDRRLEVGDPLSEVEGHPTGAEDHPSEVGDHLTGAEARHQEEEAHRLEEVEARRLEEGDTHKEVECLRMDGQPTAPEEHHHQEALEVQEDREAQGGQEAQEVAGYHKPTGNGTLSSSFP